MKYKPTELFVALTGKDYDRVKRIVESGIDVDCLWNAITPLRFAVCTRMHNVAALLIANGADVNRRSSDYLFTLEPPLVAACRLDTLEMVRVLLQSPALNIDQVDFFGKGALYYAVSNFNAEMTELLLDSGAYVRIGTQRSNDPLFLCISAKRGRSGRARALAKTLISRGCNVDTTALQWTVLVKDKDMFKLIIRAGYQMANETFLTKAHLQHAWPDDHSFHSWVLASKATPLTLKIHAVCAIRNRLVEIWRNVQEQHVQQLQLPATLIGEILLND